jgi:hypothetical protein
VSSTVTAQLPPGSLDTAGISVSTATPTADNPRAGTIYDFTTLAAAQPIWFHPLHDGRYLMVNAATWSAATPGGGVGSYASYTASDVPSWLVVDGVSGATAPVPGQPTVPFLSAPSEALVVAGASRHPGYLFLLHAATVGGSSAGIVQHFSVATSGAITLAAEEVVPTVGTGAHTVVFDRGLQLTDPYLIVYGSDSTGTVYAARKPWSKIGVTTAMASPQTHRSLGATQVAWEYYTGTGYSPDSTECAPLTTVAGTSLRTEGPISLAQVKNQLILATVDTATYTAQVHVSRSGRPITPIGPPIVLGNTDSYQGGGLGLQPTLTPVTIPAGMVTAIPYVISTKLTDTSGDTLKNTWGTLSISV